MIERIRIWLRLPATVVALALRIRELEERVDRLDRLIVQPSERLPAAAKPAPTRQTPRKWSDFRAAIEEGETKNA